VHNLPRVFATLVMSLAAVLAAQVDTETTFYKAVFKVNPDGTYTATIEHRQKALTQAGVEQVGQASMVYSESMQELEVLEAYTLKADGTKIPVPEDKIFVQSPPETQGAPTFSDNKLVQVVFPQVAVGDEVYVAWKLVQKKPYFPGEFYATDLEPITEVVRHAEFVVDAPADMPIYWKKRGDAELGDYRVEEKTEGGRHTIVATFSRSEPIPPEPGMVDPRQVSPALVVTTFKDWPAIGAAYRDLAKGKAEVTEAIQKTADEVAGDAEGLEAAHKLYNWVVKNIRYVALELGIGGYVPQSAEEVLNQRYGDCKGYVTLLQALLKAKGIESEPVLIYLGEDYSLFPAPTPEQFNHAILYLPEFDLYLDPTMRYAPFGVLVLGDLSKPVVHAGARPRFAKTPSGDPGRDRYQEAQTFALGSDGTLSGEGTLRFFGYVDAQMRTVLASIPKVSYPQVAQALLGQFGEGGSGTFETSPLEDLDTPLVITAKWKSPGAAVPGERLSLGHVPTGFSLIPFSQLRTYAAPESRRFPVSTGAFAARYEKTIRYPEGYRAVLLPQGVNLENEAGSVQARFEDQGDALKVTIELVVAKDVYPPGEYPALKKLFETAVGVVSQPIVLEKK